MIRYTDDTLLLVGGTEFVAISRAAEVVAPALLRSINELGLQVPPTKDAQRNQRLDIALADLPAQRSLARVRPFSRTGNDKRDSRLYRRICLLLVCGKVLEKLLVKRLKYIVNQYPLASERQIGFRIGKSLTDVLTLLWKETQDTTCKCTVTLLFDINT